MYPHSDRFGSVEGSADSAMVQEYGLGCEAARCKHHFIVGVAHFVQRARWFEMEQYLVWFFDS